MECTIKMSKVIGLIIGFVAGVSSVFVFARFIYRPTQQKQAVQAPTMPMASYIDKQKETLTLLSSSEFDTKTSQQLEVFTNDAITMTDTAKNTSKHPELQQFSADSTYNWGYSREGARILQENLGLRPKHEGKHCDSVGSC